MVQPRAKAHILLRFFAFTLVGVAAWTVYQDHSREAVASMAITVLMSLLSPVKQLLAAEKGDPGRRKAWHAVVLVLVLAGLVIGFAMLVPRVAAAVSVGVDALLLVGAVFRSGRSAVPPVGGSG
jgi:hypothetical protein